MPMNASDLDHVTFIGEFGLVFKAHLKWNKSAKAEVVAIKTMKGTIHFQSRLSQLLFHYIHIAM